MIDKILNELEHEIEKTKEKYNEDVYHMGRCDAYSEMINFIHSLLEESGE